MTVYRKAEWNEARKQYIATDTNDKRPWYSDDGSEWIDGCGSPIDTAEFRNASLALVGGPFNGDVVL